MAKRKVMALGYHYHPCYECSEVFIAETTDSPYPSESIVQSYGDDPTVPYRCGCDGSFGVEDKLCNECATAAYYDNLDYGYDDDRDYGFADPGGRSALRAEVGGSSGHCPSCKGKVGITANFCKHCGQALNPRKNDCPTCGARGVLTNRDVELHYQCDRCADRAEGVYVGGDY